MYCFMCYYRKKELGLKVGSYSDLDFVLKIEKNYELFNLYYNRIGFLEWLN